MSIALNDTDGTTGSTSAISIDELKGNSNSLISSRSWLNKSVRSYTSLRNIRVSLNESLSSSLPNENYIKDNGDAVLTERVLSSHILENDNSFYQETLTDLSSESSFFIHHLYMEQEDVTGHLSVINYLMYLIKVRNHPWLTSTD